MKVFYDFEFLEDGKTIEPISLGMINEKGKEFYCVNLEFEPNGKLYPRAMEDEWLMENVFSVLYDPPCQLGIMQILKREEIADAVLRYFKGEKIELIGDYVAYDHVCMAQLFGKMIDLPKNLPFVSWDIQQYMRDLGLEAPSHIINNVPHNAFSDAKYTKQTYDWLKRNHFHPGLNFA